MPTLSEILATHPVSNIEVQPAYVLSGTYDPEDGTGFHTGWFYNGPGNPNTGYLFLDGASSESEAHDAVDALLPGNGYKRATPWECTCSGPYPSMCYVL